jgi:hypothetical protein
MVHKRYIKRGGKTFGPYYYESYRDKDGNIRKRYLKGYEPKKEDVGKGVSNPKIKSFLIIIGVVALALLVFSFMSYEELRFTGKAIDVDEAYLLGEPLDGYVNIRVMEGELIPADSVFRVVYGDVERSYNLGDYVSFDRVLGDFYAEGVDLEGSGEGFGLPGVKESCPTLDFELEVYSDSEEGGNSEGGESEVDQEDGADEGGEEVSGGEDGGEIEEGNVAEQEEQDSTEEVVDEGGSGSDEESSGDEGGNFPITGEVISENSEVISGSVACDGEWSHGLEEGERVEIIGVWVDGEEVSNSAIDVSYGDGEVVVLGDYEIQEQCFGEECVTDEEAINFRIAIEDLDLEATEDDLLFVLEYEGTEIARYSQRIVISDEDLVDRNESEGNETGNETVSVVEETQIEMLKDIPTLRIPFNGKESLNLDEYFEGAEEYSVRVENIRAEFDQGVLTLIPEEDFKGARKAVVVARSGDDILESNAFTVLVSSGAVRLKTTRSQIKVGETVKVRHEVEKDVSEDEFSVEIPKSAKNLKITEKDENDDVVEVKEVGDVEQEVGGGGSLLTGDVVIDVDLAKPVEEAGFLERGIDAYWYVFRRNFRSTLLVPLEQFFENNFGFTLGITGRVVNEPANDKAEVVLNDPVAKKVELEYELPAPEAFEKEIENGKEITISGPDEEEIGFRYEDVLASTEVADVVSVDEIQRLKLYWVTTEVVEKDKLKKPQDVQGEEVVVEDVTLTADGEVIEGNVTNSTAGNETGSGSLLTGNVVSGAEKTRIVREEVLFDAYDLNFDGNVDYVEWVVPHLSNQTYELVIVDANATSNITEEFDFSHLSISSESPYDSLVGYWGFDGDNASTVIDFTGNNNNGIYEGDAVSNSTGCLFDDCSHFDGNGDYVNVSDNGVSLDFNSSLNYSWSFWVKPLPSSNFRSIIHKGSEGGGGYYILLSFSGEIVFEDSATMQFSTTSTSLNNNEWAHVVLIYDADGDQTWTYIDGELDLNSPDDISAAPLSGSDSTSPVRFGVSPAGLNYFNGSIDEMMIFNRSLTSSEVSDIYNNQSTRFAAAGEILFEDFGDLSAYTDLDLDVSDCETAFGSYIQGKVNDGSYQNLSGCAFSNYDLTGISGLENANVTLRLVSDSYGFYTPLVIDRANLTASDQRAPSVAFNSSTASAGSQSNTDIFIGLDTSDTQDHYSFIDFNNDVMLWLRLDDVNASGSPTDLSTYSGNCTLVGSAPQSTAAFGQGFDFDGSDNYINCGSDARMDNMTEFTYSAWINPRVLDNDAGSDDHQQIIGQDYTWRKGFVIRSDGDLFSYFGCTGQAAMARTSGTGAVVIDTWQHVVSTFNGTNFKIYVNGVEQGYQTNNACEGNYGDLTSYDFIISTNDGTNNDPFNGTMDEIMIFNRTLSEAEVLALYNASVNKYSRNFTDLSVGTYNFTGYAVDVEGNLNSTESRVVTVESPDTTAPNVNFTGQTPANGSTQSNTDIFVNLSSSDDNGEHYSFVDFDSDVLIWLRMDDINGNTMIDLSSYSNNGTLVGDATQDSSGRFGSSVSLDGDDDYVGISSSVPYFDESANYTWSLWIKLENYSDSCHQIFGQVGQGAGYTVWVCQSAWNITLNNNIGPDYLHTSSSLAVGEWTHLAYTISDGFSEVYVNGVLDKTKDLGFGSVDAPLWIGKASSLGSTFNGSIDEFIMFNRTLSSTEIGALYNATANQYSQNFTNLNNGNYTFIGHAIDGSGNRNQTDERTVTVSILEVDFVSPTPKSGDMLIMNNDILVNISFVGENSTVYLYDSSMSEIDSSFNETSSYFVNFSNLAAGVYYFNATAWGWGGSVQTETRTILISPDGDFSSVIGNTKISDGLAGFPSDILDGDVDFGDSVANIGDLNGDGVQDLVVGASEDGASSNVGAIYILFMNNTGGVESNVKISEGLAGFSGFLTNGEDFGSSVANIGDLNGDGVQDLAVGAENDGGIDNAEGVLHILFMNNTGGVENTSYIGDGVSGFNPSGLGVGDHLGSSVANIGDLNGDGIQDIAVGAMDDENLESGEGAIYILFMDTLGRVDSSVKISDGLAGFNPSSLGENSSFGSSVVNIGDLNGDGVQDLAVGARGPVGTGDDGAVYILFMNNTGGVESHTVTSLPGEDNYLGESITNVGDLNGDRVQDLAVGTLFGDAIYILFMNNTGGLEEYTKISDGLIGFNPDGLESADWFGNSISNIGDLNGDGVQDLAVGAVRDENLESNEGALYILYLGPDTLPPSVNFTGETPTNGGTVTEDSFVVNLSSSDDNGEHYSLLDFDQDVLLWMRFENGFNDSSSYGNNGSYTGAEFLEDGIFGNSYLFPPNSNLFYINSGGFMSTRLRGSPHIITSGQVVPENEWAHIGFTYNGTTFVSYVNGVRNYSWVTGINPLLEWDTGDFYIGRGFSTLDDFDGSIDEFILVNRTLSDSEVLSLYNATANQYYNSFSVSSGNYDLTGYAVDGSGNLNQTETREVSVDVLDTTAPSVNFTGETPTNGGTVTEDSFVVNLSSSDDNGEHYSLLDFDQDVLLWMRFENGFNDSSSYGNNGSYTGAEFLEDGIFGNSYLFPPSASVSVDALNNGSLRSSATNFSFSVWVKSGTTGGVIASDYFECDSCVEGLGGAWGWKFVSSNAGIYYDTFTVAVGASMALNSSDVIDGTWYHLVITQEGTNATLYIDGVNSGSKTRSSPGYHDSRIFRVGNNSEGDVFWGNLDEAIYFDRVLSASEIGALYNATSAQYSHNFTGLGDGSYDITGYAVDLAGNLNSTETRSLTVELPDTTAPNVNFTGETPSDGTTLDVDSFVVNLSSSDDEGEHYSFVDFDDDLVLWMRMEGNGTNVVDSSSYSNNGSVAFEMANTSGRFGNAYAVNFQHINVTGLNNGALIDETGNFSISVWVKTTGSSLVMRDYHYWTDGFLQFKLWGWSLRVNNGGISGGVYYDTFTGNNPAIQAFDSVNVTTGDWEHIVISSEEGNVSLYVNGVFERSALKADPVGNASRSFIIGDPSGTKSINIDEVMIFNRALNSVEIGALFNATVEQFYRNFSGLANGDYDFIGYAVDDSGNLNSTETRTVTVDVDSTTPSVYFTTATPNDGELIYGSSLYVAVGTSDVDDEDTITFNLYDSDGDVLNSSGFTNGRRNINWTGLGAGNYSFEVVLNETDGSTAGTGNVSVRILPSCLSLAGCTEDDSCVVTQDCVLNNNICSGDTCDFTTLKLNENVKIYTLYGSNGRDAADLSLDLSATTPRSSLTFMSGSGIDFSGKGGSSHGTGTRGGDGGDLNITVYDLLNTTNGNLTGRGGYTSLADWPGGDGGSIELNYHGLIRKFPSASASVSLGAANSVGSLVGTAGGLANAGCSDGAQVSCVGFNKDLDRLPRDVDINDDGQILPSDRNTILELYNLESSDSQAVLDLYELSEFPEAYDISGDGRLSVVEIARIGFEFGTR